MKPLINNTKIVEKGWGYELWIINNEKYCGKSLFFNENSKCSMHYHLKKEETCDLIENDSTYFFAFLLFVK